MALRVKVSARAANQVRSAARWWAANRPAAPGAIAADFGESVALLAEQPGIGASTPEPERRAFAVSISVGFATSCITWPRAHSYGCSPSGTPAANVSLCCEVDAEQVAQADSHKAASSPCVRRLRRGLLKRCDCATSGWRRVREVHFARFVRELGDEVAVLFTQVGPDRQDHVRHRRRQAAGQCRQAQRHPCRTCAPRRAAPEVLQRSSPASALKWAQT